MIKKGSNVKVLVGKDKNKTGEIIELDRKRNRAKIKGINMIKKHLKTTKERKGGIVDKENFVHLSNLKLDQKQDKKKAFIETMVQKLDLTITQLFWQMTKANLSGLEFLDQ